MSQRRITLALAGLFIACAWCMTAAFAEPDTRPAAGLRYRLAGDADAWPADKRERIVAAMDEAVAFYNANGRFDKELLVSYNAVIPTADANSNGRMRFGGSINTRTALHEIAHTLGVGTVPQWKKLRDGDVWTGEHATALLRSFDGPDAVLHRDRQHFWPYGLNFAREDGPTQRLRHVRMVAALRQDMGLDAATTRPAGE